jgi:hypothetical protein
MSSLDNNKRDNENKPAGNGYPDLGLHSEEILIIAKTIPLPSKEYQELVCTVGITKGGKLIRLYPIPYRFLEYPRQYKKYQWVSVDIEKNSKDYRIDSYRPLTETIKPIGLPLPAGKWTERKHFVLPLVSPNLETIQDDYDKKSISLAIFKPKTIELKIEKDDDEWSAGKKKVLSQKVLFGPQPKKLDKLPFKFSYNFTCDNEDCKGHSLKIIDWEISELYRNLKDRYQYSMDVILDKMKQKWQDEMWRTDKDSYLIVGTTYPYPSFVVLGVFWPPKV